MKRRNNAISGQFSARLIEMMVSPAYRTLSLAGHRAISRVEVELAQHGGNDNGKLPVTFDDFEEYGLDRHSIAPALKEAGALGFIEITERGRQGLANRRKPNLFRLTYRPLPNDRKGDGTHEWRAITSIEQAKAVAKIARQKSESLVGENTRASGKSTLKQTKKPVKTPPPETVKTPTTIYISGEDKQSQARISGEDKQSQAREAHPSGGAVASGRATEAPVQRNPPDTTDSRRPERPEVLQNRIASRIGSNGWEILGQLSASELQTLTEWEARGHVDAAAIAMLRLGKLKKGNAA